MTVEYKEVDETIANSLNSFFKRKNTFVTVNPGNVLMTRRYCEIGSEIEMFPVRKDDLWLISYPRTGSTWAMEMVWLLGNNFDYEGAKRMQALRTPLLELTAFFKDDLPEWHNSIGNSVQLVNCMQSPRFIKSHLPWQLLPRDLDKVKPKIIYMARNPKDLCVSYYHYLGLMHGGIGKFDDFINLFLNNNVPCGSMWNHVLEFWNRRNDPNILFLKYEDMKNDLPSTIYKCADFIGVPKQTINSERITEMCDYLKFDKMQKNKAVNLDEFLGTEKVNGEKEDMERKFIRKGQIGDWKNYMSNELSEKFDKWIDRHSGGTGLCFEYDFF